MSAPEGVHEGTVEALRFVLRVFNDETDPEVTYTLSGTAGPALVHQMITLLRVLADHDTPEGEDPEEFIRRFLTGLIEHHTLAALDEQLAGDGDSALQGRPDMDGLL